MNIETKRTIIRNFNRDDLEDLYKIFGDQETMKYVEPAYNKEKTLKFLESFCIKQKGALACVHKETHTVIGYILFKEIETHVYEIGWIFNKVYWGCGYTYEACNRLIEYAFDQLGVKKIFAETIDYDKSVKLMKKLGMKEEGLCKKLSDTVNENSDVLYSYSIYKEDR